jgi:hypothetical protein
MRKKINQCKDRNLSKNLDKSHYKFKKKKIIIKNQVEYQKHKTYFKQNKDKLFLKIYKILSNAFSKN